MTTQNPRLTITLQPSLAAQLRRLSQLTGNSQSSLISELLDGSAPVFDRLIRVLTAAEGAKASLRGHLAMDMAEAQAEEVEAEVELAVTLIESEGPVGAADDSSLRSLIYA